MAVYTLLLSMQNLHSFNGCFVLYHDITTLLRVGDFSLWDPESGTIVALGEQKAGVPVTNMVSANMTIIGEAARLGAWTKGKGARRRRAVRVAVPPRQQARLRRQQEAMANALSREDASHSAGNLSIAFTPALDALAQVLAESRKTRVAVVKANDSLVLMAVRAARGRLYQRLTKMETDFSDAVPRMQEMAKGIVAPGSSDNQLLLDTLMIARDSGPNHLAGMPPLFWWGDLPRAAARALYLRHATVVTIFNPAQLLAACAKAGFTVVRDKAGRLVELQRKRGKVVERFTGLPYFFALISRYLVDAREVASMVVGASATAGRHGLHGPTRIDLKVGQYVRPL